MKNLFTLLALLISSILIAQEAKITGTVFDKEFQEPLPFANVLVKEIGSGTTTDFDGIYEVFVQPGTYTLEFSFVGYETIVSYGMYLHYYLFLSVYTLSHIYDINATTLTKFLCSTMDICLMKTILMMNCKLVSFAV